MENQDFTPRHANLQTFLNCESRYLPCLSLIEEAQKENFTQERWDCIVTYAYRVCYNYGLQASTLAMASQIVASFLERATVLPSRYSLVTAASTAIAAKYLEPRYPCLKDLAKIDGTFTVDELKQMEKYILYSCEWALFDVSPFQAMSIILKEAGLNEAEAAKVSEEACVYIDKLTLRKQFIGYRPSSIAFVAIATAALSSTEIDEKTKDKTTGAIDNMLTYYEASVDYDEVDTLQSYLQEVNEEKPRPLSPSEPAHA
uniref:Cyclin-like domain-containing protein n=1 Tax=Palpitomonas bilix TaxID=652834 RepID=A0A7S3DIW4_9EUKA|mmetsp:Transcript_3909/g.7374  ORF Transcript_3909/g.7374 Transcript_3909/m.7374 type:complete len:258 (+) Transcript_3909:529-1302(+)